MTLKEYLIVAFLYASSTAIADFAAAQSSTLPTDGNLIVLGSGILTPASKFTPINDASDVFTPREGSSYYQITYGTNAGTNVSESLTKKAVANQEVWRRAGVSGHETDFAITAAGVFKTQLTDPDHKLLFQYDPGEPEVIAGMAPGESRQFTYTVRAAKLSDPTQIQASGQMKVDFSYMGEFEIMTPVGPISAHGFSKVLAGKIGPTINNTALYVFYAAGIGEVARIDHTDIHALMLYNRDTRTGYLLQKLPVFAAR